jgi:hypothetical protein
MFEHGAHTTTFTTKRGGEAQACGWTVPELFGLHPVPERPAANYSRLSRVDDTGLLWLLRGRSAIVLTSTEAVIRCHSGATLKFYRPTEPAPPMEITNGAPAMDVGHADRHDHCRPVTPGDHQEGDSMSGRQSRDKGNRTERAIVRLLQAQGIAATKISGITSPAPTSACHCWASVELSR